MSIEIEKLIAVEPDVVAAACRAMHYMIADLKHYGRHTNPTGEIPEELRKEISDMEVAISQLSRSLPITAYLDLK